MGHLPGSAGPSAACKLRANLSLLTNTASAVLSRERHRRAAGTLGPSLTFEEESFSPDLSHSIEVSVASVWHIPPQPAQRQPGERGLWPQGPRPAAPSLPQATG